MHPLDIVESDRWNEAIEGLEPRAPLGQHARMALEMLRSWLEEAKVGRHPRTRTGRLRVLPRSVPLLARQYIYDRLQLLPHWSPVQLHYARRYYVYALEVAIGQRLEIIAFLLSHSNTSVRNTARQWMPVARQLGLEDA